MAATEEERMDFKKIADEAKDLADKRGGTESVKEDLDELKGIAGGEGSLVDKAKAVVEAVNDPGGDSAATKPAATKEPAGGPRPRNQGRQGRQGGGEHHRRHQAR